MRPILRLTSLVACIIIIGCFLQAHFYQPPTSALGLSRCQDSDSDGISSLITSANAAWDEKFERESKSLAEAAVAYRKRRGRHPPPGFDVWYERAARSDAVIIEDFFDQIHKDLELFWGVPAAEIRDSISGWDPVLEIRKGKAAPLSGGRARSRSWAKLIAEITHLLPNMDLVLNGLDEPDVIASRDTVDEAMYQAAKQRKRMDAIPLIDFIQKTGSATKPRSTTGSHASLNSNRDHFHRAIRGACPRDSAMQTNAGQYLNALALFTINASSQRDFCEAPQLVTSHGYLIGPSTIAFTTSLLPIFSTAKIRVNNDILLPDPAYFEDKAHSGKDFWGDWSTSYAWKDKIHGLIWRGAGTGGSACANEWPDYHRHRFVSRLNATSETNLKASSDTFASWLSHHADVSFIQLYCDRITSIAEYYSLAKPMKMSNQYKWKYPPDIDGNTLSGRFKAFMRSNSAVMKATIFTEWHDARLMPWKHYIPLDMSFENVYEIMKYFLGYPGQCAHDREGERIASEGREWAEKALRKEDMLVYVHRLLLEYARIVDDDRDRLGYVQDLLHKGS